MKVHDVFREFECGEMQETGDKVAELGITRSWRTLCALLASLDLPCRQWGAIKEFKQESYKTFEVRSFG